MTTNAPRASKAGHAPRSRIAAFPGALLAVLAFCVAITSFVSFQIQQQPLKDLAQERLARIADAKVLRFTGWLRELHEDGYAVSRNHFVGEAVARWLGQEARADAMRDQIAQYLSELITAYNYDGLVLFDRHGEPKLAIGPYTESSASDWKRAAEAYSSDRIAISNFEIVKTQSDRTIAFNLYAPLLAGGNGSFSPVAVLMIRINATAFISPLIQEWPVPSASAEALLVQREGDNVVFLTAPRHPEDAPINLTLPLSRHNLPAAIAVLGKDGEVNGVDYRGVPVVAALRRIPDSEWHLVAKIDTDEAYAPVRELALTIAAIATLAFFGIGGAVLFWWRAQRAEFRAHEAQAEARRTALVRHFDYLAKFANDIITLTDAQDHFVEVNDRAASESGYSREELLHMKVGDLLPAEGLAKYERNVGAAALEGRVFEASSKRKDGSIYPVEVSARTIEIEGRRFNQYIVRNITERKRAERVALEQFRLAETFFNHSVSCLVLLDRNFNFVRVNEAYARACRKEIGEFAGRNHFEMYPSDTRPVFEDVVRNKRPFTTFTRAFTFPDQPERGTTYWDWTLVPILDEQGEVEYLVFSLNEVTERKRAEEEQRAAALYARSLIEASLDPLVTISAQGKITDVNKSTEDVTGRARDSLVGTDFADYFTEPDKARAGYQEVQARGYVRDYPLTIRHSSGRSTDVLYNASVYRNEAGELQGVFAAARDITERKRIEDALRRSEKELKDAQRLARIGNWDWDIASDTITWSEEYYRIYGFDPTQRPPAYAEHLKAYTPESAARLDAAVKRNTQTGESYELDLELAGTEGPRRWITARSETKRDARGQITGLRGTAQDITEKKYAERALHKVNRALKALSSCNEALIHATGEDQLLNDMCRIIVGIEGYRLAWVGYVEHDAQKSVKPVARSGYEPGYMDHADITWADNERGRGPLGIAIRSGQVQVVQDVMTDPRFEPWRANAARLGYGSMLVAPLSSDSQVIGALSIYADSVNAFDAGEITLLGELAADMAFGIVTLRTRGAQERSAERLLHSMEATIQVIASTVEMRDPYTAGHQRRVAELATAIARNLGLAEDQVHGVHLAGVVHDLGKIHIPAEILSKPGKLTSIEFDLIKMHPQAGYEILKGVDFLWPIAQIVLQHHERLNGSGYPHGLKADEILLEAKILMVADVVEAMASHRPYRPGLGIELALQEIAANAGKIYDAEVVRVCSALFREKAFAFKA